LQASSSTIANPAGDARARIEQLLQEVQDSLTKIIQTTGTVIESLGENFEVILPKVVRLPEGTYLHQIETPLGIASWLLESRGDKYPHRLKLRPASLHTVLALSVVLPGTHRADISKVVASLPFVAGDFDR
jgi:NADH-quinone oxidoreductase subunit D